MVFRRDYGKHLTLIDQLVSSGFIVHDRDHNSYRLHLPFLRVLEGVYISQLLADINALMSACRNHYRTWFDDPVTLRRLSDQSELDVDRVKSIARYLQWAGLLAIPRGSLDEDSRLLVNEYILEPSSIEEWMDRELSSFDVNADHGERRKRPPYSTPMLALIHQTVQQFYAGRERSAHPGKTVLVDWLREHKIEGKSVSKSLAEAIYQILKAPERRRAARTPEPAPTTDTKKATAKKTSTRKTTARKTTAKKTAAKKTAAKKTAAKKTAAKKTAAKKTAARKTTAKKAAARKTTARKTTAKKSAARKTTATSTPVAPDAGNPAASTDNHDE